MNTSNGLLPPSSNHNNKEQKSPVEEFHQTFDRIEQQIVTSRESYRKTLIKASQSKSDKCSSNISTPKRKAGGFGRFLTRSRSSEETPGITTTNNAPTTTTAATTPPRTTTIQASSPCTSPYRNNERQGPIADFIPMEQTQMDVLIEDLRRLAELCIIGENFSSKMQKKHDMAASRAQRKWAAARDALLEDVSESEPAYDETSIEYVETLQLFDLFFERNALSTIVDMLHGESFSLEQQPNQSEIEEKADTATVTAAATTDVVDQLVSSVTKLDLNESTTTTTTTPAVVGTLLPPLSVATQALQSISILIQNVSRVTSLYAILSNNCINKLIDLPLHLYTVAEKRRYLAKNESNKPTSSFSSTSTTTLPAIFASPQITELATHFVTFLKSLALRMNAETLQFFIKYNHHTPSTISATTTTTIHNNDKDENHDHDPNIGAQSMNHTIEGSTSDVNVLENVDFPLYVRALEFCAAHHDSFVRTTALNICLNTIRLTTITNNENDDVDDHELGNGKHEAQQSSPNAILHNAKALPYHERLVIAQYACIPSRVEYLISPIFTKLAERWTAIDEQIRLIDTNKHMGYNEGNDEFGLRNERVALAKEKVRRDRLLRNFKDAVADLQDELLLLDDVFQVSLK
jgi:Uncharacterised conserved protein